MGRKCAVPGCSSVANVGFPHPSKDVHKRFTSWLIAIRNDDLVQMAPMEVYLSKRICRKHFSVDAFIQGSTALKRAAIPSLLLPVFLRKDCIFHESCLKSGLSRNVSDLPPPVAAFLRCQLREAGKKNKGRRFTLDDKILSLSLLKRSGRAYNFLSDLFVLPSRRTLVRILSSLSFQPGINDDMFNHLSVIVENQLSEMDKLCVLLFDEMSLTPYLDYNVHSDIIEGFEDLGGGKGCEKFANNKPSFLWSEAYVKQLNSLWPLFSPPPL